VAVTRCDQRAAEAGDLTRVFRDIRRYCCTFRAMQRAVSGVNRTACRRRLPRNERYHPVPVVSHHVLGSSDSVRIITRHGRQDPPFLTGLRPAWLRVSPCRELFGHWLLASARSTASSNTPRASPEHLSKRLRTAILRQYCTGASE
jgi:hypothetical protein